MSLLVDHFISNKPSTWDWTNYITDFTLIDLSKQSMEYTSVKCQMGSHEPTRIERVQNPYLWASYQLKKNEEQNRYPYVTEMDLWHATSASKVRSIVSGNLDWRLSVRCKFGQGVSFSPDADYANTHCSRSCGSNRALILTRVLVGRSHEGSTYTKIPFDLHDTTTGNKKKVYVKYSDDEFYPTYVAYYQGSSARSHHALGWY